MPANDRNSAEYDDMEFRFLPALALALVNQPRATLQELANSIGVSKATLYRFCPSKKQLIDRLISHVALYYINAIKRAELDKGSPEEALSRLINAYLTNKEFGIFMMHNWRPDYLDESHPDKSWINGQDTLDAFFLRGQKEGAFRLDISAAAMTELFYNILAGLIDAERRGRIPRNSLYQLIELSLNSCLSQSSKT